MSDDKTAKPFNLNMHTARLLMVSLRCFTTLSSWARSPTVTFKAS
jgi:hypothetical protein